MTKSELIERITSKNPHLTQKDVDRVVSVIFDTIESALAKGDRVEFRGFGTFSIRTRNARVAKILALVSKLKLVKEKYLILNVVNIYSEN